MPRVAEIATITTREYALASLEIKDMAKLVHASMLREAVAKNARKTPHRTHGTLGYQFHIAVSQVAMSLWPDVLGTIDSEARADIYGMLRLYLQQSNNAECVVRKDYSHAQKLPIWWVSLIWNPVEILLVHRHGHKPDAIDLRAERLSPAEAGETREAEPVEVRLIPRRRKTKDEETSSPTVEDTEMTPTEEARQRAFSAHIEKVKAEYQAKLECIVELLDETSQPLVIDEIAHALGVKASGLHNALGDLLSQDRIFRRTESAEERRLRAGGKTLNARRASLYSTQHVVPPRTETIAVDGYSQKPSPSRTSPDKAKTAALAKLKSASDGVSSGQTLVRAMTDATGISSKSGNKILREMVSDGTLKLVRTVRDANHSHYTTAAAAASAQPATAPRSDIEREIIAYMRRGWNPQKDRSSVVYTVRMALRRDASEVVQAFDSLVADGTIVTVRTRVTGQGRTRFVLAELQSTVPADALARTPSLDTDQVRQTIIEKFQRGARTKQFSAATEVARRFLSKREATDLVEQMIIDHVFTVSWQETSNGGGRKRMLTLSSDMPPNSMAAVPTSFPPDRVTPAPAAAAPVSFTLNGIDAAMETLKAAIVQTAAALTVDMQSELDELRAENARLRENENRVRKALFGDN